MLSEFFELNHGYEEGQGHLYTELPGKFVWDATRKKWNPRITRPAIGRLVSASPSEGERYYLRLLLIHVRGPKSFEDLRTVRGVACTTFQEAALRHGLLEQDNSIDECMNEAMQVELPCALRRLLVTLLIFCQPSDPQALWNKYYGSLSEDYKHTYQNDANKILQLTVRSVEKILEGMGKSLKHFNLEHLLKSHDHIERGRREIVEALNAPIPPEYISARKELNDEQRQAYKCIMQHIKSGTSGAFFIDGPGGTGKTFLYCALYAKVRQMGKIVLPTATSGIAASNIPTGRTAHSRFKIPLDDEASMTCDVLKQSSVANLLREASLIIWDEASMAKKDNIEALDILLRDICSKDVPFGGKVIVFGGDFPQVLPVLPKKTQQEAVEASLVSSHLWEHFIKFKLSENIRARDDPHFCNFLLELGNGTLQLHGEGIDAVRIPAEVMLPFEEEDSFEELVQKVYPEIYEQNLDPQEFTGRAILAPTNDGVDSINKLLIEKFPGNAVTYKSFDDMIDDKCDNYPCEFLNTLCPGGMSPHQLVLKVNCPVILLRNMDPAAGLCNGTRLTCKKFFPNMIQCEITTGYNKGEQVFLPRIIFKPSASSKYPYQFQRKQFPIKLCFAMTINKAQGQTLQQVGIYLRQPCFSHGQLYVALSRARKSSQLTILAKTITDESDEPCLIRNVVSFDILARAGII